MRLYYVSFFYFNIILFVSIILRLDWIFLILFFLRKTYSVFKESLTEYIFQEFDGIKKESQIMDLYENKLYVDFGLDAGLEEYYIQNLYMTYSLFDISLDFEMYNGNFTFKWNDFNLEELNKRKNEEVNFKKVYLHLFSIDFYVYKTLNKNSIIKGISDEDYLNIYNYKGMNKREVEEPFFFEENEKYYYNNLKKYFLKENFYDTYVKDNYIRFFNYNIFLKNLKEKVLINKYKSKSKSKIIIFKYNDLDKELLSIKKEILYDSYLIK